MANIIDYLQWRGDIPFSVDPFNEVDNLILSELVYTDFTGIVPEVGSEESVSISQVQDAFFSLYSEDEILNKISSTKVAPFLMKYMAQSKRFSALRLTGYEDEIDEQFQSQFAAVTFLLEDGTNYVAYRGTDNTIVGWKEDFNMSFLNQTNGQMQAADYLNRQFAGKQVKLRVGGHSKGGNFAVYASAFCDKSIKNNILEVYSNDGPGFSDAVINSLDYLDILPRVKSTIPESSIVGLMLEHKLDNQIVTCSQSGAIQHDMMTWEILGNKVVLAEQLNPASIKLDKTLKRWVYGLELKERKVFVNALFDALQSTGATTLDELSNSKLELINEVMKRWHGLSPETQKVCREVFSQLHRAIIRTNSKDEKNRGIKSK